MAYHYPTTREQYFSTIRLYRNELKEILQLFAPQYLSDFDSQLEAESSEISQAFHEAWFNAPDKEWIHSIPGWSVLCDLCSEDHLLF